MSELSSDTKQAFGRMLVFLKTAQTADNVIYPFLVYADTLIVWTEAGLRVMDKYEFHKDRIIAAKQLYKEALHMLAIQDASHAGYQKEQIMAKTFEINALIFPVAMMEGVLVLNQEMINVSGLMNMPEEGH